MIFTGKVDAISPLTACEFAKECYPSLYQALGFPLRKSHGCTFGETRVSYPLLNGVYKHEATVQELQLPYSWWLEEEKNTPEVPAILQLSGCTELAGSFCSMVCALDELKEPAPHAELTLELITNEQTLKSWSALLCQEFSIPETLHQEYAEIFIPSGFHGPCYHFAGLYQGQIVTTGTLLCTQFGAYVYNITTRKEFRHQGFASLMTYGLLLFAK